MDSKRQKYRGIVREEYRSNRVREDILQEKVRFGGKKNRNDFQIIPNSNGCGCEESLLRTRKLGINKL